MKTINFNSLVVSGLLCLVLLLLTVYAFPQQYHWAEKDSMPMRSAALSSCYYDGKIYAIGGSDGQLYNNEYGNDYFMIYDLSAQSWSNGPALPSPRMMLSAVEAGGKIYAIGGGYPPYLNNINECYDPVSGTWSTKAPMPIATSCFVACNVDGLIYTIGGTLSFGKTHCYNPVTDTWTEKASMPFPATGIAGTVLDGKIYVTGGVNGNYVNIDKLQVYNPATNTWDASKAAMDTVRFGHSMGIMDNKVIVLAGCVFPENKAMKTVSVYDVAADTWADMAALPDSLQWGATCCINNKIYIMGGEDKCMMSYTDATIFNYLFELSGTSGISLTPTESAMQLASFPNPFNNNLSVNIKLDYNTDIRLELIDFSGRAVEEYLNTKLKRGTHNFNFNTGDLEEGAYYLRLNSSEWKAVNKVIKIN